MLFHHFSDLLGRGVLDPLSFNQTSTSGYYSSTMIGLLALGFALPLVVRLANFIYLYFFIPSSLGRYNKNNAYALVTGASDGIGRRLAHEVARRGFNLVLHGRNQSKLETVKASIQKQHPTCKIIIVIGDASNTAGTQAAVAKIAETLRKSLDGPLTVLLNNCGGTQPLSKQFSTLAQMTPKEIDEVIALNATWHVQLTRALMPLLFAEEGPDAGATRRPALIMYTGSVAGVQPGPWLTTYSPAKAFGNAFMVALGREMRATAPWVECINILVGKVTDTAFFKKPETFFEPSSSTMAKAILDRVGCGRLNVVGYWTHAIQIGALETMPEWMQTWLITYFMKAELIAGAKQE